MVGLVADKAWVIGRSRADGSDFSVHCIAGTSTSVTATTFQKISLIRRAGGRFPYCALTASVTAARSFSMLSSVSLSPLMKKVGVPRIPSHVADGRRVQT